MIEQEITLLTNGRISFQKCGNGLQFGYSKNRGVYSIRVKTSGEWNGLTIRAFWHIPDIKEPITSLLVDNVIKVPALVTSYKGEGRIVFEGSDGTKTVTSADVRYYVNKNSGTCDGTIPEPGTPAWQQLVEAVHADATAAEQAKTDARKSADEAKQALEDTKNVKDQAIENIGIAKDSAIEGIEDKKSTSIEEINKVKESAKKELEDVCNITEDFANQAKESADKAKVSELAAKESETKSKISETNSKASENLAEQYKDSALESKESASQSEVNAIDAANRAAISEANAKLSETASDNSSKKAFDSETKAKVSETNSANSAINAEHSATNATASADAAKSSADKAKTSETVSAANTAEVAKNLEAVRDIKAKIDILDANVSANAASSDENANNARISAEAAKQSETNAASSEASALESKNASAENVVKSQNNASNAKNSADSAKESETRSQEYSNLSQSNANASSESASNAKKSEVSAKASEDASKKNADDSAATLQELKDGIASGNFKGEKGDKGDPGPAVALDTTLTHKGEAADAKATGDEIGQLKEDTEQIHKDTVVDYSLELVYITPWQKGFINYRSGAQTSSASTTQARTYKFIKGLESITCDSLFKMVVYAYQDGAYNNFIGALTSNGNYSKTESTVPYLNGTVPLNKDYYYLFSVEYVDGSTFSNYDIAPLYYSAEKGIPIVEYAKILNETVSKNLATKVVFDKSFTSRAMINVYKDANGYYTDYKTTEHKLKNTNGLTYYVSTTGSDENNGLTPDKPLLTLAKALEQPNVLNVICLEGEYTFTNGIVNANVSNVNLIGIGNCIFNYGSAESIKVIGNCYIENITFKGGWQNIKSEFTDNDTLIVYKCKFIDCKAFNSCSFTGGNYYLEDCYCKGSYYDGFNYHNFGASKPNMVEINCRTEITGNELVYSTATGNSCNGSTIHNNGRIIRLNCNYKISHGGVVADKTGMSYNIGCNAEYSTITSEDDDRFKANYWFEDSVTAWLISCTSSGSKYDISSALGAIVYTDNLYDNNYCDELSQINLIN